MTCRNYIPGPNGERIERLHGLIEQLAARFKGYMPWPERLRDATVRGHEAFIEDTIKKADAIRAAEDCQRCEEMGINHAGTGYTLDEIMAAAQSGEIDRARAMFNASVKFRCGEMNAGHAGHSPSTHPLTDLMDELRAGHAGPTLYPMRAGHAKCSTCGFTLPDHAWDCSAMRAGHAGSDEIRAALEQAQRAMQHAGWCFHEEASETRSAHDRAVAALCRK